MVKKKATRPESGGHQWQYEWGHSPAGEDLSRQKRRSLCWARRSAKPRTADCRWQGL